MHAKSVLTPLLVGVCRPVIASITDADFDLTAIDNAACQACHQQRYDSFADDHPDFGIWPYERRTRIAFNHASHQAKHFAEKKQAFDCRTCHVEDATRQVQLLASYEAACASCHDEKIATSVARGVPMLALPTLDVDGAEGGRASTSARGRRRRPAISTADCRRR